MAITEQEEIEIEKNIWDLIHLLYTDEQNVKNNENENFIYMLPIYIYEKK